MVNMSFYRFDNPELRQKMEKILRKTYWCDFDEQFFNTKEGKIEIESHVFERYHKTLMNYIPWITKVFSLEGKEVLEIGCGTGSSTAAFSYFSEHVFAYEIAETSIEAARGRMQIMNISNVDIIKVNPRDSLKTIRENHGNGLSVILLFAVLEHMTIEERLETLHEVWDILDENGILIVAETPNRLTYFDHHTSWLPFFHMLPVDLAVRYCHKSPRQGFKDNIHLALQNGFKSARTSLIRWGNAVGYHEFELTLGDNLEQLIIADSDAPEIRALYPASEEENLLRSYFSSAHVNQPIAFTHQVLNIIFQKKALRDQG